jgi:hypothetical protein
MIQCLQLTKATVSDSQVSFAVPRRRSCWRTQNAARHGPGCLIAGQRQSRHDKRYDAVVGGPAVDAVAGHRFDDRPFLPKQRRRLVYIRGVYLHTTRPPSTFARDLKEEGVADRLPIAVHRHSFLSHSASPLICVEPEQIAFSIWIFVRRDCDAEKIRAQCCKHLTIGTGNG